MSKIKLVWRDKYFIYILFYLNLQDLPLKNICCVFLKKLIVFIRMHITCQNSNSNKIRFLTTVKYRKSKTIHHAIQKGYKLLVFKND